MTVVEALLAEYRTRTTPQAEVVLLPEESTIKLQYCADPTAGRDETAGITYQRCGGGRRVIRKRIGGN